MVRVRSSGQKKGKANQTGAGSGGRGPAMAPITAAQAAALAPPANAGAGAGAGAAKKKVAKLSLKKALKSELWAALDKAVGGGKAAKLAALTQAANAAATRQGVAAVDDACLKRWLKLYDSELLASSAAPADGAPGPPSTPAPGLRNAGGPPLPPATKPDAGGQEAAAGKSKSAKKTLPMDATDLDQCVTAGEASKQSIVVSTRPAASSTTHTRGKKKTRKDILAAMKNS